MQTSMRALLWILCVAGITFSALRFGYSVDIEYILLGVITILLFSHVFFGEYFISREFKKIKGAYLKRSILLLARLVGSLAIISTIFFLFEPIYWLMSIIVLLLCAIVFHLTSKKVTKNIELQEFCNYKIFIEIYGVVLLLLSIIFLLRFPELLIYWAVLGAFMVLHLNDLIFFKKRLYDFSFIPPNLSAKPLVSIVVIAYNEELLIGKTLECIEQQTYKHYEVILVDDHSTDKTIEVAKKYSKRIPLSIVQKAQKGPSRSRNYGASLAKGELLVFLDADTCISKNFLEKTISEMHRQHLSAAAPDFVHDSARFFDSFIEKIYGTWLKVVQFHNPRAVGFCLVALKKVHDKILFDESILVAEDFDYIKRASRIGKFRIIKGPRAVTSWRRFRKENKIRLLLRYLMIELYRQHIGEIRREIVSYEFGKYKESDLSDK